MQAQSGDCQLLSSCVLVPMGFQTLVGDWNQTTTRAAACMDGRHVEILEAAFPGGAFHPCLNICSPIYREALRNTLTLSPDELQLQALRQVNSFLYGEHQQNSNDQAFNMYNHGLLQAFQELK
eukprot:4645741-Heterocapsa_arctica.AAC.1